MSWPTQTKHCNSKIHALEEFLAFKIQEKDLRCDWMSEGQNPIWKQAVSKASFAISLEFLKIQYGSIEEII